MSDPLEILRGVVHPWYCDSFGHMNVRFYSHFFDDAAFHLWPLYWGSHQKMQKEFGVHTVTASAKLQFQRELVAGDLIVVDSVLARIGNKSCTFIERILHADTMEIHATYETVEVFFDPLTRQSTEMPAPIRQALELHNKTT
ncbi:thioesterase family protein [Thalassotalea fonticola]|uniref:Thioesterase family protein n=1 Tax=Thalassotalea fonticola TaxID=3065649 RepID=A0ABZ0GNW9_9GAMM|nr:thioesterase family protein [Colwelliaceae bacterium S1-1]